MYLVILTSISTVLKVQMDKTDYILQIFSLLPPSATQPQQPIHILIEMALGLQYQRGYQQNAIIIQFTLDSPYNP